MQIIVKNIIGKVVTLDAELSDTIESAMKKLVQMNLFS